ncbi:MULTISPECIES: ArsR/SmtB family transcription factor [Brevibacterium]|uniref:Transcriptional regulator, ArsR family n=1 Tax=Brevibacterium aurantiacum TaxID=273384 RepID=A0A2H1JHU1_BREAU|nr:MULTISPECIES: winged helix-turn-helix domain-containing protein [Brevibacterium]MDN5550063.1 winged helix-turn-helix domain-containing protein [Brevibacterium sp.]AOP52464.1 Transcriptional regulator, ArsR family [Brevibacterium aurantiacum]AZL04805.1 ArsR family transcriptional regulator [Brevibacterium aurantiacum]AZL08389.1 ArsR family transcriptional regulator [Brevibacterium aurantiacum]AZL11994.1 ArsR family transcriptional regulator [Brevibacterium aurantiacum]
MTRSHPESAPDIAALASALADPTRVMICTSLLDGRAWTLTELSRALQVPMSSTSEHVSILIARGVLAERRQGRHRYVQLASRDIADWLEHTGALAGERIESAPSLAAKTRDRHLLEARTCYRHIAGHLGVQIWAAVTARGWADDTATVTEPGISGLAEEWGIDVPTAASISRPLTRACLDWTERRTHLGGWLGDAICAQFLDREWIVRRRSSRALTLTPTGRDELDWILTTEVTQL